MLRRAPWIRQLEDAEELLDLRKNAEYALERWESRREKLKYVSSKMSPQSRWCQQKKDTEELLPLRKNADDALDRWESRRDELEATKTKTTKPNHEKPNHEKPNSEKPKKIIPKTDKSNTDRPKSTPVSSTLDALLHSSSSTREAQSQTKILASHLRSGQIMTHSDYDPAPEEARGSPMTSSGQDKHTAKKATSVQGAKLTSSPTPRPQKRKASSAASKPKDAKRARVDKYQSNDESKKDSGVKTATDVCSPEAPSLRPTVGCADTDRSEEAANATQDLTVPSPDTHSSGMAIDDADPRRKKIINRTKAQPTSLSSKTTPAKSAPGGANSDDKDQVDTTPAIGGSSLKRASTTAQKSTQGIESENARPARQEPSPKPLVADRGNNAKGSKDAQETSSISIPKQLPNVSLPPSSFSTEGRSDGGAEINGPGAAEMGRDDQEANDISNHQGSSDVSPPEPVRGGAEARNEDKAAFTDVEMGEAGLDAESQAEPDEEPDKRLVALVGVAVGAGAAALQYFAT